MNNSLKTNLKWLASKQLEILLTYNYHKLIYNKISRDSELFLVCNFNTSYQEFIILKYYKYLKICVAQAHLL